MAELSLTGLQTALKNGNAEELYPVGTEIPDTTNGKDDPLVVAQYLDDNNNSVYGGARGVFLFRKYVSASTNVVAYGNTAEYANSSVLAYLNTTYLDNCSNAVKQTVSEVGVPQGDVLVSGKWHLMSALELGSTGYNDGFFWEYWKKQTGQSEPSSNQNDAWIGLDTTGEAGRWWLRDKFMNMSNVSVVANPFGVVTGEMSNLEYQIRPVCFIAAPVPMQHESTFEDVDYGCGEKASIYAGFNLEATDFAPNPDNPTQALVTFSYINKLELSNVKYSTATDQDVSAWLVYNSSAIPLGSTERTFVPREDCTTTTNSITSTVQIPITSDDTFVRFGGRWSGFDETPDGLALPGLEWFEYDLPNTFSISAPQNLQVTFGGNISGTIQASIDSWSENPNITSGKWVIEVVDKNEEVVYTKEIPSSGLTESTYINSDSVPFNAALRVRVSAVNSFGGSTSIISPVFYTSAPKPIFQRIQFFEQPNGKFTASIDVAKPRSSGASPESLSIKASDYTEEQVFQTITDGSSWIGNVEIPDLPPATLITFGLYNKSSLGGGWSVWQDGFTPAKVPDINILWDDVRRCARISATSEDVSDFEMGVGDSPYSNAVYTDTGSTLEVCDLEHGAGQILYARATPKIPGHTYTESTNYATFSIPNPILGVAKTCDNEKYIVDIVENKQGTLTKKWQTGKRIVKVDKCPGVGLRPNANYPAGEAPGTLKTMYVKNGMLVLPAGEYDGSSRSQYVYFPYELLDDDFPKLNLKLMVRLTAVNPNGFNAISGSSAGTFATCSLQFKEPGAKEQYGSNSGGRIWNLSTAKKQGYYEYQLGASALSSSYPEGYIGWEIWQYRLTASEDIYFKFKAYPQP